MAAAASRTTNPLLLATIIGVVALVVTNRRGEAPWARGFRFYLLLALVIIGIRIAFRALLGGGDGDTILFRLPEIPLPATVGFRLGGPVSAEAILAAVYDGLRLATLLLCLGAANVLANPKRLLKAAPAALHEIGVSVTVALSVAPQLIESAIRIRRARKLRGGIHRGRHAIRGVLLPVLEDALDRSLRLAAAMDVRGYGRRAHVGPAARRATAALVITGTLAVCVGTYGSLDATAPRLLGAPTLLVGLAIAVAGTALAGRQIRRTVYRPDPWRGPEWAVAGVGVAVAVGVAAAAGLDPAGMYPSVDPLAWPHLPAAVTGVLLLGALPAWLAPPVTTGPVRDPRGDRRRATPGDERAPAPAMPDPASTSTTAPPSPRQVPR
ncbi:energy-coupling factor transporter transmembrane protein EcfT [Nitriliruptoraceae bacterium ZYF776]|nr:energy-coupling factor transporter transmembrane protein EcfT [Profundirhabdus halotolerans]